MQYDYKKGGKLWALNQGQKKSLKKGIDRYSIIELNYFPNRNSGKTVTVAIPKETARGRIGVCNG